MPNLLSDDQIGLTPLSDEDIGLKQLAADELKRKTLEARIEGQQAKAIQTLADVGAGASYWIADALAKVDPTGIANQMLARQGVPRTPPILKPEDVDTAIEVVKKGLHIPETAPAEGKLGQVTRGLSEAGKEMVVGMSDPGMFAGLGLAKAAPQEGARLFQYQMMGALPSTTEQALQAQNLEEAVKGGVGVAANVGFPIALNPTAAGPRIRIPEDFKVEPIQLRPETAPIEPKPTNAEVVKELALQAQRDAGWNPKWPFVPADLGNPTFREAIRNDPNLSKAEKDRIFTAGDKLLGNKPATERSILAPEKPEVAPIEKPVEEPAKPAAETKAEVGTKGTITFETYSEPTGNWEPQRGSVVVSKSTIPGDKPWRATVFGGSADYPTPIAHIQLDKPSDLNTPKAISELGEQLGRYTRKISIEPIEKAVENIKRSVKSALEKEQLSKAAESKPVEPLSDEQIGLTAEKPAEAPVEAVNAEPVAEPIPQGPGARTGTTVEAPESYEGTGLKNAIGEVERVSYGLPEATPTQRRAMGEAWIKSARVLQENPLAGERLVSELRNNPKRALTDEDSAVLLRHKVGLENEMNRAAELTNIAEDPAIKAENQARYQMLSDQLLELLDMAKARGSEWGREGRWRQAIANQDYSFATMESRTRASLGGRRLTESERSKLQKDYEDLQQSQKAYEERLAKREAEVEDLQLKLAQEKAARAEAGEGPAIHPTILKIANDIVSKLDTAADRARARIRERATRFSAGIDPTVILDLTEIGASHLAHKVLDFAKWSDRMIGEFGDWVKPHLEEVFAKSQKAIDDLAERHGKTKAAAVKRALKEPTAKELGDAIAAKVRERIEKKQLSAISAYLQRLARALWKEGVRDRDEIVKQMHAFISQEVPDITPREVSRMWSGYGDYRQLSKDEISVGLRKLKGELLETHKLEDMAEGRPPLKSGSERGEISEARRQLIKKVNDAKYKFQIPIEDPNTQLKSALDTYKTTLQNRIADLEDRMARKDYAPRARRELVLDETAMDLKAKNLRVRQRFEQELEKNRLANRKPWQKLLDNFVRWERAFKLSSPVVFGKLGAAAMTRLATTTAEEAVGAGLGKLPVISEVAKRAPREGGISIEGMSKGLAAMVTKGIQDAKQTAKSGMTDLDILLGKEGGLDREWVNVFGQLHGMMKAPIKRFEYELSLQKRIEAAMRNGEDVRNREVMLRLMTEAMNDGYRSIFMQRGFSADLFNTALHMAETSKKYQPQGEIFARTMRFLLPIVRVPVNIVSETATGITGIPVASARVMFHAINGSLKTMDPKVADAILRQFKKGSIGAGLMAIGFMNPDNIGGYDWREKRGPNAPKAGGFQLFGWNVPRWMTHAPWFELMQFGATLRHAVNNKKKGLSEGALAASVGLLEQTPFYGEMMRVTQAGESGSRFGAFTGELARSTIVPQALQKIAEWTDFSDKKRKPKNWYQHIMYGVPGLRQYVPEQTTNSNKF